MSKIMIDDIKKDRRSLRDVLPSSSDDSSTPKTRRAPVRTIKYAEEEPASRGMSWVWGTIIVVALVILVGYFVAPIFTKVSVTVTQKTDTVDIEETLKASRDTTSDLTFTVLPAVEKTLTVEAPATGSKQVETKASGKIRITNTSNTAQPLVATTRFITTSGKLYRLNANTTVPAGGSVDATVTADKTGSDYNIGLSDFTLPGLAGSAKADKVTARSLTAMSGGQVGIIKVVASSTEASVRADLSQKIKTELLAEVRRQLPEGFFTSDNLVTTTYDISQLPQSDQTKSVAVFSAKGTASAIVFDEAKFTAFLMKRVLTNDNVEQNIKITNLPTLVFNPTESNQDWSKVKDLSFTVSGKSSLLWQIDPQRLAKELAGKPKNSYAEVFDGYGDSITGGEVKFKPAWSRYFPSNPEKISVELLTAK